MLMPGLNMAKPVRSETNDEAYPKTKIAEIDKILADIAAQKSKDEQYKGFDR
jgi:hypothetical protein